MRRVGVGTAYRRFPDERQLIEELLDERVSRMVQLGEHALAAATPGTVWPGSSNRRPLQISSRGLKR